MAQHGYGGVANCFGDSKLQYAWEEHNFKNTINITKENRRDVENC